MDLHETSQEAPHTTPGAHVTPAIAFVGKSGSGKTTLTVKVIAELTRRGHRVGSIKHHGHKGFDIDVEGKDSWRQTQAGSVPTVIASPDKIASYRQLQRELEFSEIVVQMDDVDVVVVEGYRHGGVPSIELFRADNPRDADAPTRPDALSSSETVGIATDMPAMSRRAQEQGLPCFALDDAAALCDFVEQRLL